MEVVEVLEVLEVVEVVTNLLPGVKSDLPLRANPCPGITVEDASTYELGEKGAISTTEIGF